MSVLPSNIHAFVTFKEDAIFAGETIEATITFQNVDGQRQQLVAAAATPQSQLVQREIANRPSKASIAPTRPTTLSRQGSVSSQQVPPVPALPKSFKPGHRQNLSLQIEHTTISKPDLSVASNGKTVEPARPGSARSPSGQFPPASVSIMSMGNQAGEDKNWGAQLTRVPSKPGKHSRSSSLQVTPVLRPLSRASTIGNRDERVSPRWRSPSQAPTPLRYQSAESYFAPRTRNHGLGISSPRPQSPDQPYSAAASDNPESFASPTPDSPHRSSSQRPYAPQRTQSSPSTAALLSRTLPFKPMSPRISEDRSSQASQPSLVKNRALSSLANLDNTPRSSLDMHSVTDGSDETVISEYQPQAAQRLLQRPPFVRAPSGLGPNAKPRAPETLMMGFAYVSGSFVLDGSLANQAPFEEVKRKAVVGGQGGGGVVGIDQRKQEGGFFGSFGWSSIGESLTGLLNSGEMSSLREMKGIASADNVPLLSTPKSILFVDLTLAPGESRSYSYKFTLPRGLPPSHKGRAMKVSYNLVVGTQRPAIYGRKQQIRQADVPFRVFSGVNGHGEDLGHDLMSPYTILRDQARTSLLEKDEKTGALKPATAKPAKLTAFEATEAEHDFDSYVKSLLDGPRRRSSSAALLSPTAADPRHPHTLNSPLSPTTSSGSALPPSYFSRRSSTQALSPRALVDLAILRSTQPLPNAPQSNSTPVSTNASGTSSPTPQTTSPTHFTIARSSRPIATLMLSRPYLRLGDTLHFTLDFSAAKLLCLAVDVSLESTESLDASLALRSNASVDRATRRLWDRCRGQGLVWAQRWAGELKAPWAATPGFSTTGVEVKWAIRIEIMVRSSARDVGGDGFWADGPAADQASESGTEGGGGDDDDSSVLSVDEDGGGDDDAASAPANDSVPPSRRRKAKGGGHWLRAKRLLRTAGRDERGTTHRAVSAIQAESFEITVPVRVFGAVGAGVTVSHEERRVGVPI